MMEIRVKVDDGVRRFTALADRPAERALIAKADFGLWVLRGDTTVMTIDADLLKEDAKLRQTYLGTDNYLMGVKMAEHTKKLKPADLPKSWEDVANPKFKGMVALDDPMRAGPLSSMLAGLKEQWKDNNRFNKFVKGLKALGVPVHKSTSAMFRLVISGEYAICMPALLHDVMEEKAKGTPVDYIKTVPPVVFPRQAGIYIKAPNPNAAKLFAEWAISTQGQQVIDSVGRETSRKDFKSKTSIESAYPKGTKAIPVSDKLFLEDPKKWLDINVKPIWEG